MLEFNKDNFEAEVLQADGLVMVDFWGEKCEPCLALMPEVVALAEKNAGRAKFGKFNTAGSARFLITQKVMGLPTIAFYKGGEKVVHLDKDAISEGGIAVVQSKLDELLA
ncbi:MAG: thioredoxin family protein [Defluviitaleaceae bacterium]|nr:thioredoxin family protein [Defluviitaleaceae bacterium]